MKRFLLLFLLLLVLFLFALWMITRPRVETVGITNESSVLPTESPFVMKGMAVIGDSQSDEYRADDARGEPYEETTLNWVEQLVKYRSINVGSWGAYDEPRRLGYEYNWARSGMTAERLISSGQHVGVADQVKNGDVSLVVIYIGANDYAPYNSSGYPAIYNNRLSQSRLEAKRVGIVAAIRTTVETIQSAGNARIVLVTVPDWGVQQGMQLLFPDELKRRLVSTEIAIVNNSLVELSNEKNLILADVNEFYSSTVPLQERYLSIDGVEIDTYTVSNNPRSLFLADDIHPGTILNSLFSNYLISLLNERLGLDIEQFTTEEISRISGLASSQQ